MFRKTEKYSRMGRASVAARAAARNNPRSPLLPDLRLRITVERFDAGEPTHHVFELKRGKRIDMYKVFVDGVPWKHCGLSAVLAGIRKATPRLISDLQ